MVVQLVNGETKMRTLTREEAAKAGERAYQIVNGFATPRGGASANDALNLAHTCEQLYAALEKARNAVNMAKESDSAKGGGFSGAFDDIFKDMGLNKNPRDAQPWICLRCKSTVRGKHNFIPPGFTNCPNEGDKA